MKKLFLSSLFIIISVATFCQRIIENPKTGFSTAAMIDIHKIILSDTATTIEFRAFGSPSTTFLIPDQSYIKLIGDDEKLYLKSTIGIQMNTWQAVGKKGEIFYSLVFPKIDPSQNFIDYGEGNEGGSWFIYNIQVNPEFYNSDIPKTLSGNWLNTATGQWTISFLDTLAIYKNSLWNYKSIELKKGKGTIVLQNDDEELILRVNPGKSGSYNISEPDVQNMILCKDLSKFSSKIMRDNKPYTEPVFKQDSAIYSGYIKGYTPRSGVKTMNVHINDILVGNQNTYLVEISEDGRFSAKLPVYYPHEVYVRSSIFNGSVFLEPGKEVFQFIGDSQNNLFMGESGIINSELANISNLYSFNYYEMKEKILEMNAIEYKAYCIQHLENDLANLENKKQNNEIGAKAYQVKKLDLEYNYYSQIMEYSWNYQRAFQEKNKTPDKERRIINSIDSLMLPAKEHDFITADNLNNPLAVLSSGYNTYINRVKYLDVLRNNNQKTALTLADIGIELEKTGKLTDSEIELVQLLKKQEEFNNSLEQTAFKEKYGEQSQEFFTKYNDTLKPFFANSSDASISKIEEYLKGKGVEISDSEKEMLGAMEENSERAKQSGIEIPNDSIQKFIKKYNSAINEISLKRNKSAVLENLDKLFGIKPGLGTEVMISQDICRPIVEEYTPIAEDGIKNYQQSFKIPFIANYIAYCNEQTIRKIEANKLKSGSIVNDVPKTEADILFESIMKKYKGKVVFVDFWATWCAPCRSGIQQIKPLKEELADKDVVFVYITGPSSPEKTWANMIPDIRGEHYRVSNDEWNYLCGKFNISGIPHYTLVGKNGEVLNPHLPHLSNASLKTELEKRMSEL
ncbi:MAG: TlpA family protein disulfide reductase [Bacteroidales bacterium]|nr:TlpA family protein disulfide reductase [Bacteroidales bacterium]MBN2817899.1 TlpA family protein disulfide reductase [Bacteroidales bacterium]